MGKIDDIIWFDGDDPESKPCRCVCGTDEKPVVAGLHIRCDVCGVAVTDTKYEISLLERWNNLQEELIKGAALNEILDAMSPFLMEGREGGSPSLHTLCRPDGSKNLVFTFSEEDRIGFEDFLEKSNTHFNVMKELDEAMDDLVEENEKLRDEKDDLLYEKHELLEKISAMESTMNQAIESYGVVKIENEKLKKEKILMNLETYNQTSELETMKRKIMEIVS